MNKKLSKSFSTFTLLGIFFNASCNPFNQDTSEQPNKEKVNANAPAAQTPVMNSQPSPITTLAPKPETNNSASAPVALPANIIVSNKKGKLGPGPEFTVEVPTKDGGRRTIEFDCNWAEIIDGKFVVTMGLVSQFNPRGDMTGMEQMPPAMQEAINKSYESRDTNIANILGFLAHIAGVHHVSEPGANATMKQCKPYFGL
ncbi:MAG: hypothetical protein ACT4OY_01610 [Alphaproteobacteria bacterium]